MYKEKKEYITNFHKGHMKIWVDTILIYFVLYKFLIKFLLHCYVTKMFRNMYHFHCSYNKVAITYSTDYKQGMACA